MSRPGDVKVLRNALRTIGEVRDRMPGRSYGDVADELSAAANHLRIAITYLEAPEETP